MNYYSPHTRYGSQLEEMLDEAYDRFVTMKGGEVKQERKRSKRINTDADTYMLRGDCRVVLRNRGRAVELAKDHKPSCNSEKLRIENLGDIGRSPEITSVLKATKYTKELQSLLMEVHQLCDRSCPFTLADVVNKRHAPVSRISHSI